MPAVLELSEEELVASLCRRSYADFVREFWETVPGAGKLIWNWHLDVLCGELQEMAERVFAGQPRQHDVIFNVPPGTSKSTTCSILFQPWTWTRMPSARHINSTHTDSLVMDFADKSLQVMRSDKYRTCFPEIKLRKSAVGAFANTAGGDRLACTVGGRTPTGFHAHFLIGDDLIDPKKAVSEAELKNAREFVNNYLPSRKADKLVAVTFLVMQRLHREDPTAVMLEAATREGAFPVRHICLPCDDSWDIIPPELAENYRQNPEGLMDPVRLPRVVLQDFAAKLGAYAYAGQFGQHPVPLGGGMFKEHWFNQRVKAAPYHAKRIRGWDRAATQDGGAYTAGVLMSKDQDGNYYVEHVVHGQWEPDERNARMRATASRDRSRYSPNDEPLIYVEAEGGSSGRDAWKMVARALAGFPVFEERVTGSKDVRAEPWAAQLASGNVYLVDDGTWDVAGYIQEHTAFRPEVGKRLGKYKDQVDASSMCFNLLTGSVREHTGFRVFRGRPNRSGLRILVSDLEEQVNPDEPSLLVTILDPAESNGHEPPHSVDRLTDQLVLRFADLDPADHQATWGEPLAGGTATAQQVAMTTEHGKKLWAFLTKKRDEQAGFWVLRSLGGRRALSVAYAVCDVMGLDRTRTIFQAGDDEWQAKAEDKAPSRHVYAVVKASRGMVVT